MSNGLFHQSYLVCEWKRRPEAQADWKAIVWSSFGPKPSNIQKVIIQPSDCGKFMCIMWDTSSES